MRSMPSPPSRQRCENAGQSMTTTSVRPQTQQAVMQLKPVRTTFVLPGRNRSGGVRVTVEMANRLLDFGYSVRIVYRRDRRGWASRRMMLLGRALQRFRAEIHDDWLPHFRGDVEQFVELNRLAFERDEVVIGVGSVIVPDVHQLAAAVIRVRFCHGFHAFLPERMKAAWTMPMPTLTVSRTLIPGLLAHDRKSPIWNVPNGIDPSDYFDEHRERDGVGTIFSRNPAKCPDDIEKILREVSGRIRPCKRYVFGEGHRPAALSRSEYWQLPPLARTRELYSRAKIWLLMSRAEGLPGSVLEAMACGAAVISTDNEGSLEVIRHEENGLLFPIGDTRACMNAVDRLWQDDDLRGRLVQRGFETAKAFSWERAVHSMQNALDDLVTGRTQYAERLLEAAPC